MQTVAAADLWSLWRTITSQQASPPSNTLHQQQTPNPPDSAALGRGDSWTWKSPEGAVSRTRPEDTCSDVRTGRPPARSVGRRNLAARSASSPAASVPPLATTPVRPSASRPPPPAGARPGRLGRGHLTVRIPPAALRGLRGRSKGRAGPGEGGGGGGAGVWEAEAGAAAEAEAGGGGEQEGRHRRPPHLATSREIARSWSAANQVPSRGGGVRRPARKRGTQLPFLRRTPCSAFNSGLARVKRHRLALGKMAAVEASL